MLSKLWPVAFASRCAFSKLPQPRPVDALSACNVAIGTPVAAEILCRFAARDATVPNARMNAAMIMLKLFIVIKLLTSFGFRVLDGSPHAENFEPAPLMPARRDQCGLQLHGKASRST